MNKIIRKLSSQPSNQKHVVVVGGGVVGTTTAYYLSRLECVKKVTVVEACPEVAMGASFANAGRYCPQTLLVGPPASPQGISAAIYTNFPMLKAMFSPKSQPANFEVLAKFSPTLLYFGTWYLRNCTIANYENNRIVHQQLGYLLDEEMRLLSQSIPDLEASIEKKEGNIWIYESAAECTKAFLNNEKCIQSGISNSTVNEASFNNWIGLPRIKPRYMLSSQELYGKFPFLKQWGIGGVQHKDRKDDIEVANALEDRVLYCETDFTADARMFTSTLQERAETSGRVDFRFDESIVGADISTTYASTPKIKGLRTSRGDFLGCDEVVLCCGLSSNQVLRKILASPAVSSSDRLRCHYPLQAMRGYTIDLYNVSSGPNVCVMDYSAGSLNFQLTPYAHDRVRITSFAQFDSRSPPHPPSAEREECKAKMFKWLSQVMPNMSYESNRDLWTGLRPMLPDNLPMIGRLESSGASSLPHNLILNCGHGPMGWSLSTASASLVCQLLETEAYNTSKQDDLTKVKERLLCSLSPSRFNPSVFFK